LTDGRALSALAGRRGTTWQVRVSSSRAFLAAPPGGEGIALWSR